MSSQVLNSVIEALDRYDLHPRRILFGRLFSQLVVGLMAFFIFKNCFGWLDVRSEENRRAGFMSGNDLLIDAANLTNRSIWGNRSRPSDFAAMP